MLHCCCVDNRCHLTTETKQYMRPWPNLVPLLRHDRHNDTILTAFGSGARYTVSCHTGCCYAKPIEHHHPVFLVDVVEVFEVQTSQLIVLRCPDVAARDLVDDEQQDDRNDKGPGRACACCGKLVAHLLPVPVVPPAFVCVVHTIHGRYIVRGKEPSQDIANEAADPVDSEDVQTFIDAQQVLVSNGEERCARCHRADQRCEVDGDETSGGRDTDQTCDDPGAETDNGELLHEDVFEQDPCQATTTCCKIGIANNVDGANRQVRGGRACQMSVKAVPSS